jgi:hypothetical protein
MAPKSTTVPRTAPTCWNVYPDPWRVTYLQHTMTPSASAPFVPAFWGVGQSDRLPPGKTHAACAFRGIVSTDFTAS